MSQETTEALLEENERLRHELMKKAVSEIAIVEMKARDGGLDVQLEGGACQLIAEAFAHQLKESGANNYIEMSFVSKVVSPGERLVVTLQRASGKTPHQLRAAAENELQQLKERMEA